MRYSQYKTVKELSESLNEALIYVANTKNYVLLEDCLMAMTAISDVLINEHGREADKAKLIIADMYKILEVLDNPEEDIPNLATLSETLADECKNNLKYKLRILFVAELGSKWDSMKSVYEAFLERDDCDIDVVLEPIFRAIQLPNGETKAEIIYEDWLTPLGINHISYRQYNMEAIQPDITFISQPYESVTIPMFWPENIAKYSKLVYVPYYTATRLEKGAAFTSFFKMPVEKYAWRIICQSEKMKEHYENYASRKGENVIVTGLPKWDYPMSLTKENTPCPEDWKEKIAGKKVFLLNTHFTADLRSEKNSIDRCVLDYFLEKEDMGLIWRLHPMFETVSKLYKPEIYLEFKALRERALKSTNVVIDTNVEYAAAFVWSDALITGHSSLLTQYLLYRKPILFKGKQVCGEDVGGLFEYSKFPSVSNRELLQDVILSMKEGVFEENNRYLLDKFFHYANGEIGFEVSKRIIEDLHAEL